MKKITDKKITSIALIIGITLVIISSVLVAIHHFSQVGSEKEALKIVEEIKSVIPETETGIPDGRVDAEMPVMQISGNDFIGYMEIPEYDKSLPIYSEWSKYKVADFPCRLKGSMYDGTLIIGSVENPGQLDVAKLIAGGQEINIVDMTGLKYKYKVTDIYKTKDVSTEKLSAIGVDLVIFIRSHFAKDYMVVCCDTRS